LRLTSARFSALFDILASGTTLSDSVVRRNGLHTHSSGIVLGTVNHETLVNNEISANGDIGLYTNQGFSDSLIANNTFANNPFAGMYVAGLRNVFRDNEFVRNGFGLVFKGRANRVTGNRATAIGCGDGCGGIGIWLLGGKRNVIADNHIQNPLRVGISVGGSGGNSLIGNVVVGAGDDGFHIATQVPEPLAPSIIKNNKAIGAGDDGFDVGMASATLTGNIAVHNGDLGIEAVDGVTDGGGNHAAGNGDPRQCTNVAC
jgi:parallel beta-helix repeat protein